MADAAATNRALVTEMTKRGYPAEYANGADPRHRPCARTADPPSVVMIF